MVKAKEKRIELREQEVQTAAKTKAQASRLKQHAEDKLAYLLCGRQCVCTSGVCVWVNHSLCAETTCGALLYPMKACETVICRAIKLKKRKEEMEAKKAQDKADRAGFMACKAAHDKNGTRVLTCPCNAEARDDIEVAPVLHCKWEGWHICPNPPCDVLLKPMTNCKKRACQQFRNSQAGPTVRRPRKQRAARTTQKKQKVVTSANQYDTSSQSSGEEEPTPQEIAPRSLRPQYSA
jgi:hypothetical protein